MMWSTVRTSGQKKKTSIRKVKKTKKKKGGRGEMRWTTDEKFADRQVLYNRKMHFEMKKKKRKKRPFASHFKSRPRPRLRLGRRGDQPAQDPPLALLPLLAVQDPV
jgi:hypothetical protein